MNVNAPTLLSLSPEIVEAILEATLDRPGHALNCRQLRQLQLVTRCFVEPARRLIFRHIVLTKPAAGKSLLAALRAEPSLGAFVRTLEAKGQAYSAAGTFDDLVADDIIRLCPLLSSLDLPVGPFGKMADGRAPSPVFPSSLKHYKVSMTLHEQNQDSDDEGDHDDTADGVAPPVLARLSELPKKLESLNIEELWSTSLNQPGEPLIAFPLSYLSNVELVKNQTLSSSIFRWILAPSVQNHSLRRLKIWRNDHLQAVDILKIITDIGADLEEFLWCPAIPDRGVMLSQMLPHLTSLKKLTVGVGGSGSTMYTALATSSLTHLCMGVNQTVNLDLVVTHLSPGGKLRDLRRLEIYSQIYFPPPSDLVFLDETPNPTTQLRELRLSHVNAPLPQLTSLLALVGPGLRALSLHHVLAPFPSLIAPCPRLLRLELGVALVVTPKSSLSVLKSVAKADRLHLLRFHFNSQVDPEELVKAVEDGAMDGLRLVDVTGIFPGNVADEWTGVLIDRLARGCENKGVELCLNGRAVGQTIGSWWNAILEHASETGHR
ncbi:hypothetical protein RQP46_001023 [Phenoliferia psychrophenolica]